MVVRSWTVGALVRHGERLLRGARLAFGHGTTNARDEAVWLTYHALGLPLDAPAAALERKVAPRAARRALELLGRRVRERRPAAYLTGEAWLGDLRFFVDERVVVPRSHIAGVLRERLAPWIRDPGAVRSALDLCTGSGCLAVLLARHFSRARVDAADISPTALAVARINVQRHHLSSRIRLVESDLFSALSGKQYDLIVSNPPYVSAATMPRLPREYRHEPAVGLAGGRDGLDAVRRILREAAAHLNPRGVLVVEVGGGRRRLERVFPRTEFTWPEGAGRDAVFLLQREQLATQPSASPAPRAAGRFRAARAR